MPSLLKAIFGIRLSSHLVVSISMASFKGLNSFRVLSVQEALTIPKSGLTSGMHGVP